jgi:hypothetical protein
MTIEKAEKLPSVLFKDITDNPDAETESSATASESNKSVLDVGVKAENTHIFEPTETPSARNFAEGPNGSFAPGQMYVNKSGVKVGGAISGKMATDILNILLPTLAALVIDQLGYHFDKRLIELTADEKKVIAPAMQDYLDSINVDFNNPLYNLLFVVGAIYAAKIIEVAPQLQKKARKQPQGREVAEAAIRSPKTAVDALIQRTAKTRKQSKKLAVEFLLKEGQIIRTPDGYKMA